MLGVKEPDEPPPLAFTEKIIEDFLQGQQDEELLDCEIPITQPLSYAAQEYLKERGITKNQIDLYQIREGTGHLDSRVVVHEHLDGKLICWVGRSFIGAEPKYINAKGPTKRGAVFNLENVKDDSVVITEGVFDAMSAGPNAVAIYGKKISGKQVGRLLARRFKRFYVALDPDAMEYALSLCFRLYSYSSAQIFLVRMPTGKDPSSLGLPGFMTCLNGALVYPKEV
jgi:DNA primase